MRGATLVAAAPLIAFACGADPGRDAVGDDAGGEVPTGRIVVDAGATDAARDSGKGTTRDAGTHERTDGTDDDDASAIDGGGEAGLDDVQSLSAGASMSCALMASGRVKCWGDGQFGQLGNSTAVSSLAPTEVLSLAGATAIAAGSYFACAIVAGGAVKCWGGGALGDGTSSTANSPVNVLGVTGATAIAAGLGHACAIVAGGAAKCWGSNYAGQLGDGTTTEASVPVAVTGLAGATAIAAGAKHTCAIVAGGAIRCWGENFFGQLGNGTTTSSTTSVAVVGLTGAIAVGTGGSHTCAIVAGGRVKCWGSRTQLGDPAPYPSTIDLVPNDVPSVSGAVALGLGHSYGSGGGDGHTCVVVTNGVVRCWGDNDFGQLGNGTLSRAFFPSLVPSLTARPLISLGLAHTCVATASGVSCWGHNDSGQLGDGSTTDVTLPVMVSGL